MRVMMRADGVLALNNTHTSSRNLTGKAFEAGVQILDGSSVHVADISHQIGNLDIISFWQFKVCGDKLTSPLLSVICLSTLWSPIISLTAYVSCIISHPSSDTRTLSQHSRNVL